MQGSTKRNRKPRKSETKIQLGDVFSTTVGVYVQVIEILPENRCILSDELGNTRNVDRYQAKIGNVTWYIDALLRNPFREYKETRWFANYVYGMGFKSNNYGWAYVEEVYEKSCLMKFEDTGSLKVVPKCNLCSGAFKDDKSDRKLFKERYIVGTRKESKSHGWYEVVEVNSPTNIVIKWDDTLSLQKVDGHGVRYNVINRKIDYLKPKGYYVYFAKLGDDIMYIGYGKLQRYLHCNSGLSSSYGLNKLHFEGHTLFIEIFKQEMTQEEAKELEIELLAKYRPSCNTQLPNKI